MVIILVRILTMGINKITTKIILTIFIILILIIVFQSYRVNIEKDKTIKWQNKFNSLQSDSTVVKDRDWFKNKLVLSEINIDNYKEENFNLKEIIKEQKSHIIYLAELKTRIKTETIYLDKTQIVYKDSFICIDNYKPPFRLEGCFSVDNSYYNIHTDTIPFKVVVTKNKSGFVWYAKSLIDGIDVVMMKGIIDKDIYKQKKKNWYFGEYNLKPLSYSIQENRLSIGSLTFIPIRYKYYGIEFEIENRDNKADINVGFCFKGCWF